MPAQQQYNGAQGQFQGRSVTNGATYYPGAFPGYMGGDVFLTYMIVEYTMADLYSQHNDHLDRKCL
jgi:hypothetical protein